MSALSSRSYPRFNHWRVGRNARRHHFGIYGLCPIYLINKGFRKRVITGLLFKIISKAIKKQVPQSMFLLGKHCRRLRNGAGLFPCRRIVARRRQLDWRRRQLAFNILQGTISAAVATVLLYACQLKRVFEKIYNRTPQVSSSATMDNSTAIRCVKQRRFDTRKNLQDDKPSKNNEAVAVAIKERKQRL